MTDGSDEHDSEGPTPASAGVSRDRWSAILLGVRVVGGLILIAVGVELILLGNEAVDMGGLAVIGGVGTLVVSYLLLASAVVALIGKRRARRAKSTEQ